MKITWTSAQEPSPKGRVSDSKGEYEEKNDESCDEKKVSEDIVEKYFSFLGPNYKKLHFENKIEFLGKTIPDIWNTFIIQIYSDKEVPKQMD